MKIGIDIGGTFIKAGLVSDSLEITNRLSLPTDKENGPEKIVNDLKALITALYDVAAKENKIIESIGLGCPGIIDVSSGRVILSNNLPFKEYELVRAISEEAAMPIHLNNDAYCAALGEMIYGGKRISHHSVILTIGTGIGGALIKEGVIISDVEFGHHVIDINGIKCNCGRVGCFEAYASAKALESEMRKKNNFSGITAEWVFDKAKCGDNAAIKVLDQYLNYLSIGIANIILIERPNIFVIAGGMSQQKDYLLNRLNQKLKKIPILSSSFNTEVICSTIGNDSGILGAAFLGWDNSKR